MTAQLQRFVDAQDRDGSYDDAMAELATGRKVTHWMWWVFPQLAGLGSSPTSRHYAIADVAEARAYLAHPVLGRRLADAAGAVLACAAKGRSADEVLGGVDATKLRSSMTLFELADAEAGPWAEVLDTCFGGERDELTLRAR